VLCVYDAVFTTKYGAYLRRHAESSLIALLSGGSSEIFAIGSRLRTVYFIIAPSDTGSASLVSRAEYLVVRYLHCPGNPTGHHYHHCSMVLQTPSR
ncbi:MAG: hypothetical protein FWD57_16945, partial [Polyangiaceae bacterium]|nr:hypothetical protein [Polyangiaceae bacterium]